MTAPIRIGLMGFGRIGRQVYQLAARSDDIEIAVIADRGRPDILHYLLSAECRDETYELHGKQLSNPRFSARMQQVDQPGAVPWDAFGVEAVVDCTGIFRDGASMQAHLANGANRVLLRTLPTDACDRIVIPGINSDAIARGDRMLSAGSATTNALCLLLHIVAKELAIDCVNMTTLHSYTSDQSLQDYAGRDFRRSRSAAENIIPNTHEGERWIAQILPAFAGKVMTNTLNVPIHSGCLLDANLVLADPAIDTDAFNAIVAKGAATLPGIVGVTDDPIVSSDVLGSTLSLLFDSQATEKAGKHIIKALGWYENLGHAARLLDVVRLYHTLDQSQRAAA
ncbi:MAG TPA: glyceraldehyde 3-phosphate dehydrogenase NAD-binding domain-containing protein [Candidatus Acidoferrum sp.]|nr:glyceraldehyde 3-phosphate dehydrogenase NAD-binding domain-containing protein [Candidatus Acidoferrum sp.]